MRITHVLLTLGVVFAGFQVTAQEDDDMYFNAKDREKQRAAQASENTTMPSFHEAAETPSEEPESETINPTDSYSSRNTNPEYEARSIAEIAQEDEANYFVNDYHYNTGQNLEKFNSNYDSWSNNSMYNSNYYGSAINNWNSPYYGSNSAFYSPWGNPYWSNSGWSASFSYYYGNNYGYWNPYNNYYNPYSYGCAYNPYGYGSYNPYGYGYYGYGYGYGSPGTIVVVNNNYGSDYVNRVTYGKRPTRGGAHVSSGTSDYTRPPRSRANGTASGSDNITRGGRLSTNNNVPVRSSGNTSQEYYSRSWRSRQNATEPANNGNWSTPSGSQSGSNTSGRSSRSSYRPTQSSDAENNSGTTYTPTRSSSTTPARNSGSSSGSTYTPSRSSESPSRSSGSSYTPSRSSENSGSSYTPSRSSSSGSGSSYTPSRSSGSSSSGGGSSSGSSGGGRSSRSRGN